MNLLADGHGHRLQRLAAGSRRPAADGDFAKFAAVATRPAAATADTRLCRQAARS